MIREEEVIQVGFFTKTHGISGELSVEFINDIFDLADPDFIICKLDGILVPFFIEEYRFKTDTTALIKLQDVDSENKAKRFTKVEIYLPNTLVESSEEVDHYSWLSFKNFLITDTTIGEIGEIIDVDESTLNVLFKVNYSGEEILIPADESLIVGVDDDKRIIQMNLPEGLLSL
ncbi:Ribosome maturation factor rimM [Bacteroides coprosuis DSM 18011]|uniref:Ribosome maturation factor RimM n=1 Tax=Bacteroides coprosuis DSM 18011 TaxID=679937 RepID=F3ZNS8_9BACE|nr:MULTISPECIES: ribosome maturation factor RimM [Bacteroides]EGJ70267.1 Ribosome maturation factor rimM [Bacteroides coprosuis DSM 18011]HJD93290.1 ribosome maturation factor RimM [Bacteroides coprosuis]